MSLFALPSTFCATKTTQTWADLAAWEEFLQAYDVQTLIELGTEHGGMSTFLLCQSLARGIIFETWDIENRVKLNPLMAQLHFYSYVRHGDVLKQDVIKSFRFRPLMLFCDDGNKIAEVRKYAPMLQPGDFLAVHDWDVEIGPNDINGLPLRPLPLFECQKRGSLTRFFERTNA